jgi:hypothetical protein
MVVLAGCNEAPPAGASLEGLVLPSVDGFTIAPGGPNGALTTDQAANATPADPSGVRQRLVNPSFRGAFERVWRSGGDFVSVLVYGFVDDATAASFASFELKSVAASGTSEVFSAGRGPGEQAFTFVGGTRAAPGATDFCQGVWFAVQTVAVEVTHCSPSRPGYPSQVIDLGNRELDQITGISAATP